MLGRRLLLPLDLVSALRTLPSIAHDTSAMASHTEVLGEVAETTRTLPELRREMARVAEATAVIGTQKVRYQSFFVKGCEWHAADSDQDGAPRATAPPRARQRAR